MIRLKESIPSALLAFVQYKQLSHTAATDGNTNRQHTPIGQLQATKNQFKQKRKAFQFLRTQLEPALGQQCALLERQQAKL